MSEFLKNEKQKYEKIYVDINYAIDNVREFLPKETLNKRKYFNKIQILKEYIKIIDESSLDTKKGFFKIFSSESKHIDKLENYKSKHRNDFEQLKNCVMCECLNCIKECEFDSCLGCRFKSFISNCNHNDLNIVKHDDFTINLVNNNTQEENTYKVMGSIQNIKDSKRYIYMKNISDESDKYILYYYPNINGDSFGEITVPDEFDFIANMFQSNNID